MTWPFADPPNVAVFTSTDVLDRGMPIVYVVHDEDDGAWQFHSINGPPVHDCDARVVGFKTVVSLDPSVVDLSDLGLGWCARRKTPKSPWHRERCKR